MNGQDPALTARFHQAMGLIGAGEPHRAYGLTMLHKLAKGGLAEAGIALARELVIDEPGEMAGQASGWAMAACELGEDGPLQTLIGKLRGQGDHAFADQLDERYRKMREHRNTSRQEARAFASGTYSDEAPIPPVPSQERMNASNCNRTAKGMAKENSAVSHAIGSPKALSSVAIILLGFALLGWWMENDRPAKPTVTETTIEAKIRPPEQSGNTGTPIEAVGTSSMEEKVAASDKDKIASPIQGGSGTNIQSAKALDIDATLPLPWPGISSETAMRMASLTDLRGAEALKAVREKDWQRAREFIVQALEFSLSSGDLDRAEQLLNLEDQIGMEIEAISERGRTLQERLAEGISVETTIYDNNASRVRRADWRYRITPRSGNALCRFNAKAEPTSFPGSPWMDTYGIGYSAASITLNDLIQSKPVRVDMRETLLKGHGDRFWRHYGNCPECYKYMLHQNGFAVFFDNSNELEAFIENARTYIGLARCS